MKTLIAFLILALPLSAQTTPTWTPLAVEYNSITIPANTSIQVRYGCPAAWSPTLTLKGPLKLQVYPGAASVWNSITDAGCAVPRSLQALSGLTSVSITVNTTPTTSTITTIPASGTPPPAVCTTPPSLTYASDGTLTIVIPPYCLLIQQGGSYANLPPTTDGYAIIIQGNSSQPLFSGTAGTNGPH